MAKAYCTQCDAIVGLANPRAGTMVQCPECGVILEVISAHPLELDLPLDASWEEDWTDDEDDWEDEWEE